VAAPVSIGCSTTPGKLQQSSTATFRLHLTEQGIEARGDVPCPPRPIP